MLGFGDFQYRDVQKGNKIKPTPYGVHASSYSAIMDMMDVEDKRDTLGRVRLIEMGYINKDV